MLFLLTVCLASVVEKNFDVYKSNVKVSLLFIKEQLVGIMDTTTSVFV